MKTFLDWYISVMVVLMIIGGTFASGNPTVLIVSLALIGLCILMSKQAKYAEERQRHKEREKAAMTRFENEMFHFRHKMYSFAYRNRKVCLETWDIEEGGEYLKNWRESDIAKIDEIISNEIKFPSSISIKEEVIQRKILQLDNVAEKQRFYSFE